MPMYSTLKYSAAICDTGDPRAQIENWSLDKGHPIALWTRTVTITHKKIK